MRHQELLQEVWTTQVPRAGQASTVQGELLRAVARLEDEGERNGNVNWSDGHVRLLAFLRQGLLSSGLFDDERRRVLTADLDLVADEEHPVTDEGVWDRLHEAVGDWCVAHPDPVPREPDPALDI